MQQRLEHISIFDINLILLWQSFLETSFDANRPSGWGWADVQFISLGLQQCLLPLGRTSWTPPMY